MKPNNIEYLLDETLGTVDSMAYQLEVLKSDLHLRKVANFVNNISMIIANLDFGKYNPTISVESNPDGYFKFELSFISDEDDYMPPSIVAKNAKAIDKLNDIIEHGNKHLDPTFIAGFAYNDFLQFTLTGSPEADKEILFEGLLQGDQIKKLETIILSSELSNVSSVKKVRNKI